MPVAVVLVVLACAGPNEPSAGGPGTSGYAGMAASTAGMAASAAGTAASAAGTAGVSGSAPIAGAGGARGGSSAGAASGATSRGGAATQGGRPSTAGATSSAGKAGSAGAASVDLPPVQGATFTDVYTKVISVNCFGSGCHNPSMGQRPDFSTQNGTYNYFKSQGQLYAGQDPQKSYIYSIMHGNPSSTPPTPPYMPPKPNPNVPPDALAIVAGWIAGGAQNN